MSGFVLLAATLAAAAPEWDTAPTVKLEADAQVILNEADAVAAKRGAPSIEIVSYPDRPPLVAERQPDGSIVLRHVRLEPTEQADGEDTQ